MIVLYLVKSWEHSHLFRCGKALLQGKKYATLGTTEHWHDEDSAGIFNKNILLYSFIYGYFKH